jgi:hypothetical protein
MIPGLLKLRLPVINHWFLFYTQAKTWRTMTTSLVIDKACRSSKMTRSRTYQHNITMDVERGICIATESSQDKTTSYCTSSSFHTEHPPPRRSCGAPPWREDPHNPQERTKGNSKPLSPQGEARRGEANRRNISEFVHERQELKQLTAWDTCPLFTWLTSNQKASECLVG